MVVAAIVPALFLCGDGRKKKTASADQRMTARQTAIPNRTARIPETF